MKLVKEHINFERGLDPKDAMQTGDWKQRSITKAVKELAKEYKVDFTINNDDPEYFYVVLEYKGNYYSIGLNPTTELNFEAQYTDGKKTHSEEREFDTIEEAKEQLKDWLDYSQLVQDWNRTAKIYP